MPQRPGATRKLTGSNFTIAATLGRTLDPMVGTDVLDGWVDRLDAAAVTTTTSSLRRSGTVLPPTLHALSTRADPAYVASLVCRPHQRGIGAAVAIASMGVLPAVLAADRVVVCWEHVELADALEVPGARALQPGIVLLDADRTTHEIRFHPMRLHAGRDASVAEPEWGPVWRRVGAEAPAPIRRLLEVWRTEQVWSDAESRQALLSLGSAGYRLHWVRRELRPVIPR